MVAALAARAVELNVFAAASLSDALKEIAATYERASGDTVHLNLAASSVLARQIKEGAPADVFFSADEAKMDSLAEAGLLATGTRVSLLSNTLVVVVNADRGAPIATPADLVSTAVRRIALAEPQTVPAGIYAREYLQKHGWWDKIAAKVVATENVRACLETVATGNADAGFVYKTDALISPRVKVAFEIVAADGPKISYPLAVVAGSKQPEAARRFAGYLAAPAARAVFAKFGFLPAP